MRRLTLVTAALLLFAGCGDDDGGAVSLEGYFVDLEVAAIAYDESAGSIDAALEGSTDPVNDFKEIFSGAVDHIDTFVDTLAGMTPPSEVLTEHAATVDRGRAVFAAFEDVVAELNEVGDLNELNTVLEGSTMAALIQAGDLFSDGCESLQSVAEVEAIEVDLRCN